MKGLWKKIEALFTAAAFAEAGEFETAVQMMNEVGKRKKSESKNKGGIESSSHEIKSARYLNEEA